MTVLELLIVIAMMAVVSVLVMPLASGGTSRSDLDADVSLAVDALSQAQTGAMSGKGPRRFGVHFESGKFVFFTGASYSPGDPDNDEHDLGGQVTISDISISGGGSDIHFADYRGTPAETGSVTFTESGGETGTVTVNAAGLIDTE